MDKMTYMNASSIRAYFKDKPVDFLYIANYDLTQEDAWKKLIAFYDMEGQHILASQELTSDIMDAIKGKGFPTYLIIKKNGSYEVSKAGYPMDRKVLIKQIEECL